MKLWDLIASNQRFRKIKNSKLLLNILYVINKNLFFVYIKNYKPLYVNNTNSFFLYI